MSSPDERRPDPSPRSWGNLSEHHWSRARRDSNQEALDYYRERSKAPGVAAGGAERNFYCMECDGVIPHAAAGRCPHCGEPIDEKVRRYFNWVEIDRPVESDLRALMKLGLAILALLLCAALALWAWLS